MKKYRLSWGIWKFTLTSRDVGETKFFNSREEAVQGLEELRDIFDQLGYAIWFATLNHPGGTKENLA